MTFKILAIGDIHLGKRPSRLPASLDGRIEPASLTPAAALRHAVHTAVDLGVDAVFLAGDVVEQADDFFEAYGDLDAAVRTLEGRNIPVLAVSGNHDTAVLPRLAASIRGLHLLGAQGQWECRKLQNRQGEQVQVLGWSFPTARVTHNPLEQGLREVFSATGGGGATLGLLHCDRDQARSPYAPVTSSGLSDAPVDAWLLGHVHKPDPLAGIRPIGYLGCLSPVDPGEDGPRGPWLIECEGPGHVSARQITTGPMRYEQLSVTVPEAEDIPALDAQITQGIRDLHDRLRAAGAHHTVVACRLELVTQGIELSALETWRAQQDIDLLCLELDDSLYCLEKVILSPKTPVDLAALANADDPAGILARKIAILKRGPGDGERSDLVEVLKAQLSQQRRSAVFAELDTAALTDEAVVDIAVQAAQRALDSLLAQRAGERSPTVAR